MAITEIQGLIVNALNLPAEAVILFDIGIIIVIAAILALLLRFLKQPLIPAYIAAGLIIGPIGLGLIKNMELISSLSEIGIAFLLFVAGLEISIRKLKEVGFSATISGILQIVILFLAGFFLAIYLGFFKIEALYIGVLIAFSSTMVVIKLLHDKKELNTLHGRIILGILLIQDVAAIIALTIIPTLTSGLTNGIAFSTIPLFSSLAKGAIMIAVAFLLSKTILPKVFKFAARSSELLLITSIGYAFLFILAAYLAGLSIIIGAFIAGLSLAALPYNLEIEGRVRPLRDFFATIFFVSLGMQLFFTTEALKPALILIALVLIFKPLIIMMLIRILGYEKRTSFLSGLSLAQMSEFSLIIAAHGLILGHISNTLFSIAILGTTITMAITPYLIEHKNELYRKLHYPLLLLEKIPSHKEKLGYRSKDSKKIVILGCRRMGRIILNSIGKGKALVIDYDPEIIKNLMKNKIPCVYGDVANPDVLNKIDFKKIELLISTIPDKSDNLALIKQLKLRNPNALAFLTAEFIQDAFELYEQGADYVILPHIVSGERGSTLLKRIIKERKYALKTKSRHIKHLKELSSIFT